MKDSKNLCDIDIHVISNHVLPYLTNYEYIHKAFIFEKLMNNHERRNRIRKYSAYLLTSRINSKRYFDELIFAPIISPNDYISLTNDLIEDVLDERILRRADMIRRFPIIHMKKMVISSTIYHYAHYRTIRPIRVDFMSMQEFVNDIDICSTYRVPKVQRSVLKRNYPYAKALIY